MSGNRLGYAFVKVETPPENDRVWYSHSLVTRRDLWGRLLRENYAQKAAGVIVTPAKPSRRGTRKVDEGGRNTLSLFSGDIKPISNCSCSSFVVLIGFSAILIPLLAGPNPGQSKHPLAKGMKPQDQRVA